jgi:pimeloyl-ACP methyl ester carboxylesterase
VSETTPEFRWYERGAGEVLVFLHGLLGNPDHWEATLDALAGVCRPIALALPLLDPRFGETTIPALARYVVSFLDAVDIPQAVLGGNSLGGHVALEAALAQPERVTGLILTGSSGMFERSYTVGIPLRPTTAYVRSKMEEVVYDPRLITPSSVEVARQIVTTRATARRVLRFAAAARRHRLEERLPAIRVPTLLVWGKEDRITPIDVGERFHALIPESQLWVLTNCGHAPMLEQPHAFNAIAREWLDETWPRRAQLTRAPEAAR